MLIGTNMNMAGVSALRRDACIVRERCPSLPGTLYVRLEVWNNDGRRRTVPVSSASYDVGPCLDQEGGAGRRANLTKSASQSKRIISYVRSARIDMCHRTEIRSKGAISN